MKLLTLCKLPGLQLVCYTSNQLLYWDTTSKSLVIYKNAREYKIKNQKVLLSSAGTQLLADTYGNQIEVLFQTVKVLTNKDLLISE